MSTAEMRNLRRYVIVSIIGTLLPFLIVNMSLLIKDHFQIKRNTEIINTLQSGTVKTDAFRMYIDAINEQTKILKENDINAKEDIQAIQARLDNYILSSKRGASTSTSKLSE